MEISFPQVFNEIFENVDLESIRIMSNMANPVDITLLEEVFEEQVEVIIIT